MMRNMLSALIVVGGLATSSPAASAAAQAAAGGAVWHMSPECRTADSLRIEVRLNGRTLFSAPVGVCLARLGQGPKENVLTFTFRARPDLFGRRFRGRGAQEIEGNIWKAGGETDGMLLGVSFMTDRVLLNTLHVAFSSCLRERFGARPHHDHVAVGWDPNPMRQPPNKALKLTRPGFAGSLAAKRCVRRTVRE